MSDEGAGPLSRSSAGLTERDRAEIGDLLARYCFAIDGRSWEALRDVFAADARATYSSQRVSTGVDEIVAFLSATASAVAVTQHLLHTALLRATGPDSAAGLTHVTAHHVGYHVVLPAPEALTYTVTGTYDDRFARTAAGWRITRRTLTLVTRAGDPAILSQAASA